MTPATLLRDRKTVVLLGAGGVGKTTSAIAMAFLAARQGRKVALLSIDPAKRLAAALGIPLGYQLSRIAFPPELRIPGTIDAAMLDQKAVFDSMVRRHAPTEGVAQKILAHPLYRSASTNLAGPLEYMALAKLQELAEDPRYDLVVLDTPPDTHALDFLARPNVLSGFMDHGVMSWLIKPFLLANRFGLGRFLNTGERLMGGIAKVTGLKALQSFAEFLVLIQEVIEGFQKSGERIVQILRRPETSFLLVTIPTRAAARSVSNMAVELAALGYRCDLLLFNRCMPSPVVRDLAEGEERQAPAFDLLRRKVGEEREVMRRLGGLIAAPLVVALDEQEGDLGNFAAILALASELEAGRTV